MAELPKAEWTTRADLAALVAALGEGTVRWVGGAVRDTLLGEAVHDIDAATTLPPETVIERLKNADIRVVPTGIDHGTVTAVLDGGPVEVTTLRKDVSTDGRRATVEFASEWRDDAARRDFTINALYADPETLEIHDYFGGMADLAMRRVRFIGSARARIQEDHLRILRYYRFQARFGAELDAEAEDACAELAETLMGLSRERVGWELLNLLGLRDPSPTLARMQARGVLPVVLPEAGAREIEHMEIMIETEQMYGVPPNAVRRLAALLPPVPSIAETVAARLRLSRAQRERLVCAAGRNPMDGRDAHSLAYELGTDCAIDRIVMLGGDPTAVSGWEVPNFPLKGGQIVSRGVTAGPEVARILREVERRWISEGFPSETRVQQLLEEELTGR
ncbi:CCA tRNA nucleotidyltransferase [Tsuneonella flava]|uniref:CCA tRNA nucleotidyltransferase n=1 Tax=Tsuneonella flava TaxID=2055955 RepID=A0ABX7K8J0_9SPHN|nr:CCA tRNA nucleotidyltransferase [Tsuneonella flava]QSB43537.1 CCA tRNA nucleotidyltransferase [Tsuneonella flava]